MVAGMANVTKSDFKSFKAVSLLLSSMLLLSVALPVWAQNNPNAPNNQPEPGWGLWQPSAEMNNAGFTAGFSNMELGGAMDFESACAQSLGMPVNEKPPYWFRLSNLVNQIGTGKVEFGCWKDGRFINTFTSTAVSTRLDTVECLRVDVPIGLRIRSEAGLKGKIIGFLPNGATVKPDSSPASIIEADGRNWVAIRSPMQGWVSDDRPATPGNLRLCRPQ
jgi:hypothetical protein